MTIHVSWDNEQQTVIRYSIEGNWTWDEMLAAVATSNAWLDATPHAHIHFIHDLSASSRTVPNGAITRLRYFIGKEHPKTGQSIIVGAPRTQAVQMARSLLGLIQKLYHRDWKFIFVETLDEARHILSKHSLESTS